MLLALGTEHLADFRAEITGLGLGPVRLSTFALPPARPRPAPARVRRDDPEQLRLALVTRGAFPVSRPGHEGATAGDTAWTDTSGAVADNGASGRGEARAIVLRMPRSVLPLESTGLDRLLARPVPVTGGAGAILADFLGALVRHGPECPAEEAGRLGSIVLDLATVYLAQRLGGLGETPAEARARVMRQRIVTFIEHNLGDPDLTPRTVADRHHLSLRGLYALFQGQPLSVAASIRRKRLERCHADLARHELRNHPVQAIAGRWGFSNATAFSRAFREAYGVTPTEHRATALRSARRAVSTGPARDPSQSAPLGPGLHGAGDDLPM
ncbi:helix-turn-helix domain-containing protein [Kitasatospora sp. NPDC127111]|uniref:helix-turn-helix domain-containing protein n=1 Tax=Kitasatospora sp. NPDC127111 TaxID=3345363 RepID=UPI00362F35CD